MPSPWLISVSRDIPHQSIGDGYSIMIAPLGVNGRPITVCAGLFHVLTFRPTRVSARRTEAP